MPPLNRVLLLPIPFSLPGSLFQETRVYKGIKSPPPPPMYNCVVLHFIIL